MAAINSDTAEAWRDIAREASSTRPSEGKFVRVVGGRKHRGKTGTVIRHMLDRYYDAFRYCSEAQAHMREIAGRSGFIVLVREPSGAMFWVKADYVECLCQCEARLLA